jgi:hypothetical protein
MQQQASRIEGLEHRDTPASCQTLDHWDADELPRQNIGFFLWAPCAIHRFNGTLIVASNFYCPFCETPFFFGAGPVLFIAFTHPPSHQPLFASPTSSWRGIGVRARGRCPGEEGGIDRALLDVIGETMPGHHCRAMLWTSLARQRTDNGVGDYTKKGMKKKNQFVFIVRGMGYLGFLTFFFS